MYSISMGCMDPPGAGYGGVGVVELDAGRAHVGLHVPQRDGAHVHPLDHIRGVAGNTIQGQGS